MTIKQDAENPDKFWEVEAVPDRETSFMKFDILPEGRNVLNELIAAKAKVNEWVAKVAELSVLKVDVGMKPEPMTGTFTETMLADVEAKIEEAK